MRRCRPSVRGKQSRGRPPVGLGHHCEADVGGRPSPRRRLATGPAPCASRRLAVWRFAHASFCRLVHSSPFLLLLGQIDPRASPSRQHELLCLLVGLTGRVGRGGGKARQSARAVPISSAIALFCLVPRGPSGAHDANLPIHQSEQSTHGHDMPWADSSGSRPSPPTEAPLPPRAAACPQSRWSGAGDTLTESAGDGDGSLPRPLFQTMADV